MLVYLYTCKSVGDDVLKRSNNKTNAPEWMFCWMDPFGYAYIHQRLLK